MRLRPPSLGLVADRRFREAAHTAAPGLDVRGQISEAMGRAGLARPALAVGPRRADLTPASGLTADERRVHRILLDSLARLTAERNGGLGGLRYAERKQLEALDLAFIDAELASMTRRREGATKAITWGIGGMILLPLVVLAVILTGAVAAVPIVLGLLVALTAAGAGLAALTGVGGATSPRQQVYEALRELALVADAGEATPTALLEADLLIDRLADDDEAAHATAALCVRVRS